MEPEPVLVWCVERGHDRATHVGVGETQGVAQFMGRSHQEVGARVKVVRPPLIVIKMNVAAIDWKEGVSQGPASAIKVIFVSMTSFLKPDLNMYFARTRSDKFQICFSLPETQRLGNYPVIIDGEGVIIILLAKQGLIYPIE